MMRIDCDRCGKEIFGALGEADAEGIRVQVARADKRYDDEYLYVMAGDDEGEPVGKHYCVACTIQMLKGAKAITPSVPDEGEDAEDEDGEKDAEAADDEGPANAEGDAGADDKGKGKK